MVCYFIQKMPSHALASFSLVSNSKAALNLSKTSVTTCFFVSKFMIFYVGSPNILQMSAIEWQQTHVQLLHAAAYYITGFLCCLVCNIHYMQNRGWKSELLVVSVLNANHNVNHISLIEKRNLSWHQRHLFRDLYKIQFDLQVKDANLLFGLLKTLGSLCT